MRYADTLLISGAENGIKKKFINLFKPKHLAFILIMSYFKNDIICTNFMITISWKYSYIVIVVFMQKKKNNNKTI